MGDGGWAFSPMDGEAVPGVPHDLQPDQVDQVRWQFLCHIRKKWVTVTDEERSILTSTWNSGQRSVEYRLQSGVPMQVDFGAKDRGDGLAFVTTY